MDQVSEPRELAAENWQAARRTGALHRALDILSAATSLILFSPLLCLIALAIKLDDGGPVFYCQTRIGKGFQPFQIWKFRSMDIGADRSGSLTAPNDSRVTRVGKFLRRLKLDELPQLLNVFLGDMQLVGARPEVDQYVQMFRSQYALILQDRPGITDPASLAYRHEEQIFAAGRMEEQYVREILPAKLKLALEYQQHRNFASDLHILMQTALRLIS